MLVQRRFTFNVHCKIGVATGSVHINDYGEESAEAKVDVESTVEGVQRDLTIILLYCAQKRG